MKYRILAVVACTVPGRGDAGVAVEIVEIDVARGDLTASDAAKVASMTLDALADLGGDAWSAGRVVISPMPQGSASACVGVCDVTTEDIRRRIAAGVQGARFVCETAAFELHRADGGPTA